MGMKVDGEGKGPTIDSVCAQYAYAGIHGTLFACAIKGHALEVFMADEESRWAPSLPSFENGDRGSLCDGIQIATITFARADDEACRWSVVAVREIHTNRFGIQARQISGAVANFFGKCGIVVHQINRDNCDEVFAIANYESRAGKVVSDALAGSIQVIAEPSQFDISWWSNYSTSDADSPKRFSGHRANLLASGADSNTLTAMKIAPKSESVVD